MADGEKGWILDSLFEFLTGQMWNVPLMIFIEGKSVIFDPEDENEAEFKKVHTDYRYLVDALLSSYMQDLEISIEDFHAACEQVTTSPLLTDSVKNTLYEQLWAADNYEAFKRMMIEKNIDLQLQALEVLRKKFGMSTLAVEPSAPGEEEVLEQAAEQATPEAEEPIAKALANSNYEARRLAALKPVRAPIMAQGQPEAPTLAAFEAPEAPSDADSDEIEKRQAYLKEQRDKLIALKKEVREGRLLAEAKKGGRPRTAKAAQQTISGDTSNFEIDPDTLEVRKALAGKLRQQLIDNPDME